MRISDWSSDVCSSDLDGTLLYHTDTLGKRIWRTRIAADGTLHDTALFVEIEDGAGYPDGPTVDAEGCLWTGLFAGWAARRYDPAGRLMTEVRFPEIGRAHV